MIRPALPLQLRHSRGVTLVELLVAVSLIAILAGIILGVYTTATGRARERVCMNNLRQVYLALEMYREDHSGSPPAMLAELVPTYASRDILLCVADPYGGWSNAWVEALAPYEAGMDEACEANWRVNPAVPTSYLYAGSHYPDGWWERLAAGEDTACVACWVHGKPYPGTEAPSPDGLGPPWYTGRTVRLHFDGSVTVDKIVAVGRPDSEWAAEYGIGVGVHWCPFFDPDGSWEDRR